MIDSLFGVAWAAPQNGVWFILVFGVIALLLWRVYDISLFVHRLAHVDNQALFFAYFSRARQSIKTICLILALLLLGLALLRPQWNKINEQHKQQGRDVVIALDISRSMLAQDYSPSRLEYAKDKIKKLVTLLQAERVGLLVFSGAAVVQCPLTTDKSAFFMFLDAISVETISSGTTSYAAALQKIGDFFSGLESQCTKLVALFTDGEDFSPDNTAIRQKIVDAGIHVCTIGVATPEGAPIPLYASHNAQVAQMQGFQKDDKGALVVSRLNEPLMQQLASSTKGLYVRAGDDDQDIQTIKRWIHSHEKGVWQERKVSGLQDQYYYYAALAWILLLIEWIV